MKGKDTITRTLVHAQQTLTSTLEQYGSCLSGRSAIALTVGVPCGIAVQLVLDGVLKTPGVHAPYGKEIYEPTRRRDWVRLKRYCKLSRKTGRPSGRGQPNLQIIQTHRSHSLT
ncbi:hypothetical protein F5I97DRAFT_1905108 [Phlebopus sp. FC_14]|nr:hypothetical protein F5I97DRAFT_1905108 [Phlebopus sp. FC_14]